MKYEIVRIAHAHFNHDSYSIYSRMTVIPLNPQINRTLLKPWFFGGDNYDGVIRLWQVGNWIGTFPIEICGQQGPSIPSDQSMWILGYIYDTHIKPLLIWWFQTIPTIWTFEKNHQLIGSHKVLPKTFLSPLVTTGFVELAYTRYGGCTILHPSHPW